MKRLRSSLVLISVLLLVWSSGALAQKPDFGPAVKNYLLGLDEEFKELDFQLRHGEISRTLHAKARARLQILRRTVERLAAERDEDLVPEIEVLTADEFGKLGLTSRPDAAALKEGELVGERWRLVAIEGIRPQFFVFERSSDREIEAGISARSSKPIDPRSVIETVVVEDPRRPTPPSAAAQAPIESDRAQEAVPLANPTARQVDGPRILRFYLPGYSQQALARGIEGELLVSAVFKRDRKIKDIVVEKGLGYGLDERAKDAVRRTEFEPALFENEPIDVRTKIAFNFSLMKVTVRVRETERVSETKP